jgi:perosamine synthetase
MIPVFEPLLGEAEMRNVVQCVESGWISSGGEFVTQFEQGMAALGGRRYGVAVNNGTSGLITALKALDLPPGSEVIMPSFTIISCALAAVHNKLVPVFVDADPVSWNMEAAQLRDAVTEQTRAVMVVHIYGQPVEMDPISEIVRDHDLALIEDYSEALGSRVNGSPCGSFGSISVASTYANKAVTTGEGGVCLTDDLDLAQRMQSIRNLCFGTTDRFMHSGLGYNFRMTNLQAAVGVGQLTRFHEIVARKMAIGESYVEALQKLADRGLVTLPARLANRVNSYWMFGCLLTDAVAAETQVVRAALLDRGIDTRAFFTPLHSQPVLRELSRNGSTNFEIADNLGNRGFYLPSGLSLEPDVISHIADQFEDVIDGF